jgi:hypothetical protein
MNSCIHLEHVSIETEAKTKGCEECEKIGDSWVALRLCLSCGHVGCSWVDYISHSPDNETMPNSAVV